MARIFIDTTKTNVGTGTFDTPYNYFDPIMLANQAEVFITSTSVIPAFTLTNANQLGSSIIGYDSAAYETYWGDDTYPESTLGPIINGFNVDYSINFSTFTAAAPLMVLKNLQLLNWNIAPYSVSSTELEIDNVTTFDNVLKYAYGWKYVVIKAV